MTGPETRFLSMQEADRAFWGHDKRPLALGDILEYPFSSGSRWTVVGIGEDGYTLSRRPPIPRRLPLPSTGRKSKNKSRGSGA